MIVRVPSPRTHRARARLAGIAVLGPTVILVAGLWLAALAPAAAAASRTGSDIGPPVAHAESVATAPAAGRHVVSAHAAAAQAPRDGSRGRSVMAASQKGGISLRVVAIAGAIVIAVVFGAGGLLYWSRARR